MKRKVCEVSYLFAYHQLTFYLLVGPESFKLPNYFEKWTKITYCYTTTAGVTNIQV